MSWLYWGGEGGTLTLRFTKDLKVKLMGEMTGEEIDWRNVEAMELI